METNLPAIKIRKANIQDYQNQILNLNIEYHNLLFSLVDKMQYHEKYVYEIEFPYGSSIIKDGTMSLLNIEDHIRKSITIESAFDEIKSTDDFWSQFILDCKDSSDHPLSMVIKGLVEVFSEQKVGAYIKSSKKKLIVEDMYRFPLNQLTPGGLFGVWGTVDMILNSPGQKPSDWHASAGKSCLQFLFPQPIASYANQFYYKCFKEVFKIHTSNLTEALHSFINHTNFENAITKILIFPAHYFIIKSKDVKDCKLSKNELQNYLFGYGWKQFQKQRHLLWDNKLLMNQLSLQENNYNFHILKHLLDILNGNDYFLKLVDDSDPILFKAFKDLCYEFSLKSPRLSRDRNLFNNLLEYNTPFIFHYSTLNLAENGSWGVVPYFAPAINTNIPDQNKSSDFEKAFITGTNNIVDGDGYMNNMKTISKIISLSSRKEESIKFYAFLNKSKLNDFYNQYLLANIVDKGTKNNLSSLFPNHFKDLKKIKINIQQNKQVSLFNSFILIKSK